MDANRVRELAGIPLMEMFDDDKLSKLATSIASSKNSTYDEVKRIALANDISVSELMGEIDQIRDHMGNPDSDVYDNLPADSFNGSYKDTHPSNPFHPKGKAATAPNSVVGKLVELRNMYQDNVDFGETLKKQDVIDDIQNILTQFGGK